MNVIETALPGVLLIEPKVFGDDRGFFFESYNAREFASATGLNPAFIQDNHSRSARGVLRGLHYQLGRPQAKLVRAVVGAIIDVAVDLRRSSAHFGRHVAVELSAENKRQLWVPEGFAHGFAVLSESAELLYKTTDYWYPDLERTLAWDDPALAIEWKIGRPLLSGKDSNGKYLAEAETFE